MIAITGIGIVSPLGIGKDQVLCTLREGTPAITSFQDFAFRGIERFGRVAGFTAKDFIPAMAARRMSRFSQLAVAAGLEAAKDAGLQIDDRNRTRVAVAAGTGIASTGSTDTFYSGLLSGGPEGTNPMVFPETVQNIAASHIAMHFSIRGPNITFSQGDISAELALSYGCDLLMNGLADAVIVAGADELSASSVIGFASLGLLSGEMMPFDRKRGGFVLAEGAAALVLERLEDARKRQAPLRCLLARTAFSSSPVAPTDYDKSGASLREAMEEAAGGERPDFVSAAANSTQDLDMIEAAVIAAIFGRVPVTALRSLYGYYPSDGLLRIAASIICLGEGVIPAVAGLEEPLDDGLDYVIALRTAGPRSVLVNSFSPGGTAASVLLAKAE